LRMSSCFHCPPLGPIIDPPTRVYNDFYYPQPMPIIHPVEIVNRHHCVPVPQHYVTYTVRDEVCATPGRAGRAYPVRGSRR